jgi:vitamin B12 transporter
MKHSQGRFALRNSARLTLAVLAATSFSSPVLANDEENLEIMTVTTNRMPSENLLAPTNVITRADIERLQINDLPTLLSRQPGIDLTSKGGWGKDTNLYLRGTSARHVLILVDGVKWQSATLGETNIQDFPVEQIERIEIVRGPRSGLYGSEAIGGVIQIFTRKGHQGFNPYAKVGYGTHDTEQAAVGVNGGDENTTYNLSFNHQSTDGINAREEKHPDDDGYRNNSFSARVNHQVNDDISVGGHFFRSESKNEFDGSKATSKYTGDAVQQIIGSHASFQVNDSWLISTQFSESRDQAENFTDRSSTSEIDTRHRFANITNTIDLNADNILNIGFDYDEDHIDSTKDYLETSRDNKAAFLSWVGNGERSSWLLSGRHDDNEAFGTYNTGTAEWGYWLQDDLQITTNYGTAFKAPSFNDLYWPSGPYGIGNPSLVPEESTSWGVSFNGNASNFDWGLHFYKTKIENLIEWAPIPGGGGVWTPSNVSKAEIKGVEFEFTTMVLGANVAANASFLQPEDEETGNVLTRRAKRYANLHIDKSWGVWSAGVSWKLSGHRYDDAANDTRLGGYGLVDIRMAYQLDSDWSLQANVSNLFDKEYQTADTYNSLDRIAMFTIIYQP